MRFNHAVHNEKLSRKLHSEDNFLDWVIISAFYSVLHYSEFELFPFLVGKKVYSDFDHYYGAFKKKIDNKHDARLRLVYSDIDAQAGSAYHWLKLNCWAARYHDYRFNKSKARIALEKLDIIKSHLSKLSIVQDS